MNFLNKIFSFSLIRKHYKKKCFMSKTIFKTTIILLFVLVTYSCSEDSINPIKDDVFLTAKVNGLDFNTSNVIAASASVGNNSVLSLVAGKDSNNNTETITITVGNYNDTGTYTTESNSEIIFVYSDSPSGIIGIWAASSIDVGTGTITITEDSAISLKGTFSFTGFNDVDDTTKSITEGRFSALKPGI
jgi:uncharacterized protein DUF6252